MTEAKLLEIAEQTFKQFKTAEAKESFAKLGIDSFDLISYRAKIESNFQLKILDSDWQQCQSISDIIRSALQAGANSANQDKSFENSPSKRQYQLNMPHMAIGGLSESWYFKEIGDMHWANICHSLGKESHTIVDGNQNRLYATFVRIRYEATQSLNSFTENEKIALEAKLSRFGKSMFFSESQLSSKERNIQTKLMSTFALRHNNNDSLLKGEPEIPADSKIEEHSEMPSFAQEYRNIRSEEQKEIILANKKIAVSNEEIFKVDYPLNPYHDFNGVNLLYFAAYPIINEFCERQYTHTNKEFFQIKQDWSFEASTIARDIFYFGNCDIDDSLEYIVNAINKTKDNQFLIASSIHRKSDTKRLARIFSLKQT